MTCSWLSSPVHPEIIEGIKSAAIHLESLGATVVYDFDQIPELKEMFQLLNAFRVWAALMSFNKHEPFSQTIRNGLSKVLFWPLEIALSVWDMSPHTFPAIGLAVIESISDLSFMEPENKAMRDMGERLKIALNKILQPTPSSNENNNTDNNSNNEIEIEIEIENNNQNNATPQREGILLIPSLPTPAPFHNESLLRLFDTANTAFFNVMELPATAVPLGLTRKAKHTPLPIGFQVCFFFHL